MLDIEVRASGVGDLIEHSSGQRSAIGDCSHGGILTNDTSLHTCHYGGPCVRERPTNPKIPRARARARGQAAGLRVTE